MVHHCQTCRWMPVPVFTHNPQLTGRDLCLWCLVLVGATMRCCEVRNSEQIRATKNTRHILIERSEDMLNVQDKSFVNSVNLMSICNLKCDELWWDTFTSFKVTCRFVCKCWNIFSHTHTVSIVMQIWSIQPLLLFAGSAQSDCRCVRQNMSSRRIWVMDGLSTHKAHHVPMGFWYRWHILMGYDLIASFFFLNVKECGVHAESLSLSLLK